MGRKGGGEEGVWGGEQREVDATDLSNEQLERYYLEKTDRKQECAIKVNKFCCSKKKKNQDTPSPQCEVRSFARELR